MLLGKEMYSQYETRDYEIIQPDAGYVELSIVPYSSTRIDQIIINNWVILVILKMNLITSIEIDIFIAHVTRLISNKMAKSDSVSQDSVTTSSIFGWT